MFKKRKAADAGEELRYKRESQGRMVWIFLTFVGGFIFFPLWLVALALFIWDVREHMKLSGCFVLIACLAALSPRPAPAQELARLDGLKVGDWVGALGSIERGKISRSLSQTNGIADETLINTCMRALARHQEFRHLPASQGISVCIHRLTGKP